ncbi:MAG: nicotinamide riboside transporter PnuC [Pseudomonadota bacterium]
MLFYVEWLAVLLGIANIALLVRRSIWNYPFGIAMVSLYFVIFFDARLYGDMGLQVFFFATQIYGWMSWQRVQSEQGEVMVRWSPAWLIAVVVVGTAILCFGLGYAMERYTDAAAPYPDAAIAMMSVTAQILMVLRRIESWIYWIAVDVLAIWLFYTRDLVPTSGLYVIFLVLASVGLWQWLKAYNRQRSEPAGSEALA